MLGSEDEENLSLYSNAGLRAIWYAVKPKGRVIFGSASADQAFERCFGKAGFKYSCESKKEGLPVVFRRPKGLMHFK